MHNKHKINLAVIFYGNNNQSAVNWWQFSDLKKSLKDFNLNKYNFNKNGKLELIKDFKNGKIDIVLKNSYGRGHEADIEKFLENNKIPFLGSDAKTTFVGTSKFLSKKIFRQHKLPVAKDIFIDNAGWHKNKVKILGFIKTEIKLPCVVKDVEGTDSRGIFLVKDLKALEKITNLALKKYRAVIVEEYIKNPYEITCLVVGNNKPVAYEPVGIRNQSNALFFGRVKDQMLAKLELPASLPQKIINKIKQVAQSAHKFLGCRIFSRSDILVKNKKLYLLEVDVHPGFRLKSPTILSAKYQGENPNQLFLKFYNLSLLTKRKK